MVENDCQQRTHDVFRESRRSIMHLKQIRPVNNGIWHLNGDNVALVTFIIPGVVLRQPESVPSAVLLTCSIIDSQPKNQRPPTRPCYAPGLMWYRDCLKYTRAKVVDIVPKKASGSVDNEHGRAAPGRVRVKSLRHIRFQLAKSPWRLPKLAFLVLHSNELPSQSFCILVCSHRQPIV